MKSLVALSITFLLLSGCATHQQSVIEKNEQFMVVQAGPEDTYSSLAETYLGKANYAEVLQRYNPGIQVNSGTNLVIPFANFNPSAVFSDGYQRVPILCYHQFHMSDKKSGGMVVSKNEFERQMAFLHNEGYNVVPLSDIRPFLEGKKTLPKKSVVITIDDGYESYYDVAYPILKKYGFHSTMFVYPAFINAGVSLNWDQVKILDEDPLVDIQSHSKTHESLALRPGGEYEQDYLARLETEVVDTDKILKRRIGRRASLFAYPYGNSSKQLIDLLEQRDYDLAVTVKKGGNATFAYPYLVRRTMVYGKTSMKTFEKHLDVFKSMDLR